MMYVFYNNHAYPGGFFRVCAVICMHVVVWQGRGGGGKHILFVVVFGRENNSRGFWGFRDNMRTRVVMVCGGGERGTRGGQVMLLTSLRLLLSFMLVRRGPLSKRLYYVLPR